MKKLMCIILLSIILPACSIKIAPQPYLIGSGEVPNVKAHGAISVKNAAKPMGDVEIGSTGTGMGQIPKTVFGDLSQWTQTAVDMLKSELIKRDAVISDDAVKGLNLTVTEVKMEPIVFIGGSRCNLSLKVTTNSNKIHMFKGEHTETKRVDISKTAEAALAKAVTAILKDEEIINYIQNWKLGQLFDAYARLELLFPEKDVLEMLESPKQFIRTIGAGAQDLERIIINNAVDLL